MFGHQPADGSIDLKMFRSVARGPLAMLLLLGSGSCGNRDVASQAQPDARSSSPGAARCSTVPQVADQPDLSIGEAFPDSLQYALSGVSGVSVIDGQYVLVLLASDRAVRVFDLTGHFIRDIGREGRGPGEFTDPAALTTVNDTELVVYDRDLETTVRFRTDGSFVGSSRTAVSMIRYGLTLRIEAVDAQALVFEVYTGHSSPPRAGRDGMGALLRVSADGREIDTILAFKGRDALVHRGTYRHPVVFWAPFARRPHWDVGPDGQLAFGRSDGPWIRILTREATVQDSVHVQTGPERITPEDVRQFKSTFTESESRETDPRYQKIVQDALASAPIPESWPWFTDLRYDACGRLWIARVAADRNQADWEVYDADLQYLGRTSSPAGVRVYAIGSDGMWGTRTDSLEVVSVVMYPFLQ